MATEGRFEMSDIGKLAKRVQGAGSEIDKAATLAAAAAQEAEESAQTAEALGADSAAATLDQVRAELEDLARTLQSASAQAGAIESQTKQVGKGKGGSAPNVPAAGTDPSAVPAASGASKGRRNRGGLRRRVAQTAKKTEDIQDSVETLSETYQDITDAVTHEMTRPPEPPKVSSSGTNEPASPPTGSAPGSAVEAPTLASAAIAVGVAIFGAGETIRRWGRGWRTPEQFPEGEQRPPTPG